MRKDVDSAVLTHFGLPRQMPPGKSFSLPDVSSSWSYRWRLRLDSAPVSSSAV